MNPPASTVEGAASDGFPASLDTRVPLCSGAPSTPAPDAGIADRLLNRASKDALPVLPEVAKLDLRKVQCFYGEEEEDTACTATVFDQAERIKTKGGHHFDGNYNALAKRILLNVE